MASEWDCSIVARLGTGRLRVVEIKNKAELFSCLCHRHHGVTLVIGQVILCQSPS